MIIDGNKLTADEGKVLFNGVTASDQVHLGIYDSADNWQEIDADTDIDSLIESLTAEISDAEALAIITGVTT